MAVKTYDPASYVLAEHFLQDHPQGMTAQDLKDHHHDLALHIQQAVEDWFEDRGRSGWPDLEKAKAS